MTSSESTARLGGALFVAIAAIAFSGKDVIIKLAYRHGVDALTLLALRMLISVPLFLALAWWSSRGPEVPSIAPSDRRAIFVLGMIGYYVASYFDFLGLQYLYKTGYDPQAFVDFFEKIQAKEKNRPGTMAKAFSTHPQTPDRITKSQEEIGRILPARQQYIVTTSEFADVKARLASLENRRKLVDDKGGTKPSLRRASTTDKPNDKNGDKGGDDDRPTLHRRDD